jgi:hypothetical protein
MTADQAYDALREYQAKCQQRRLSRNVLEMCPQGADPYYLRVSDSVGLFGGLPFSN